MSGPKEYVIRGGIEGRERLRVLSRVMHDSTAALLDRVGVKPGMRCVDAGCGGGDVAFDLAGRVGESGHVLGLDADEAKLAMARAEADTRGLSHVAFRRCRIGEDEVGVGRFDLVYSRFLLTHLPDPAAAVAEFRRWLKPSGTVIVEDIDFSGFFVHPPHGASHRFKELYSAAVRHNGADPDIGPRLPALLRAGGFSDIGVYVSHPMALEGEVKLITPMTMENIREAVVGAGLASHDEVTALAQDLYAFAADPLTLAGMPRVVQAWGTVPL